jgi:hypothetical protein
MRGPEHQVDATISAYWNVFVYPTDSTQMNVRYGLSAYSILNENGASSEVSSTLADYRVDDLADTIDWSFLQNLDQFSLSWYSPFGDYTFGRQPIVFGQAKVYSPVDVIQPADIRATDKSYRPGVDAVRGTWLLGAVSELEAGFVFGSDTVAFGRLKAFTLGGDWELTGLLINNSKKIISIGTNSGIGAIGLWQETALLSGNEDNIRVTVGADTLFFDDLYVLAEVHYNGIGEASDYSLNLNKDFYQLGSVAPSAQWYTSVQGSYPINIVTQLSAGGTFNLNDGSVLVNSALNFNASENLSVTLNMFVPIVEEQSLEYEFGVIPATVSANFDWVF